MVSEKQKQTVKLRRETPMQTGWLERMQNRREKRPFRLAERKNRSSHLARREHRISEKIFFFFFAKQVSTILLSRNPEGQKFVASEGKEKDMSIEGLFVQVGIVRLAKSKIQSTM